ncbi:allophanate hydrolase [Cohnella sp. CFH 77786]|uniref:allophanate hydrolase n=1 Tax=Cohnella sp. CFH 77786 TaxID=2662265 RepID=UPI001C60C71E|nr:allophanate hydrolase [Cohnella sp. CFH 77786]MBW5444651.1 allophanate hydrolase [Cohnella sp. CFH 77786]
MTRSTAAVPQLLTIGGLRELYKKGELTPADVVAEIVSRAESDAEMNIWITPPSLEALRPYLERIASLDPESLPLWGIPFAVKDNIDLAGIPTTAACPDYAYTPDHHAAVVERLIAAGAIPLGKTNLDQFATGLVGTRSPFGETHNSLRGELISGGSSSGSAVSVARGHAAFALGTDTAGSGRVPAALNRLVGYKPSLGAWPTLGVVPACASLDCVTVFACELEDAMRVDGVARGYHADDPWSRCLPNPAAGKNGPRKLLLPRDSIAFYGPFAEDYKAAWEAAVARLGRLNIPIEFVDCEPFEEAAALLYEGPWIAERWAALGGFIGPHPGSALPVTERILRSGNSAEHTAASLFQAMHRLQALRLETRKRLDGAVLAMPTCGGTWTREQVRQNPVGTNRDMGRYTNHCNLLDLCAVAVPGNDAAPELPFGITLFALAENESYLWSAAESFLNAPPSPPTETTLVAVCGLHMRGYPLEQQMREHGARFVREDATAPRYRLYRLPTVPAKPGLIKQPGGGASIELEVWEMPKAAFGAFAAAIPAPLGIGKVELRDGSELPGFVCEAYAAAGSEDVTSFGGWRYVPEEAARSSGRTEP